jgi:hypothetical protein
MRFFVLRNPNNLKEPTVTDFLPADDSPKGEAPRCPVCGRFIGLLPLLPPIRGELEAWGTEFGDIILGLGQDLLMSERVSKLYDASGLSGLTYVGPVEVTEVKSHKRLRGIMPRYHCYGIGRSQAVIDDTILVELSSGRAALS